MPSLPANNPTLRVQIALLILCLVFLGLLIAFQTDSRAPVASSETNFFEASESGLAILPASCPSYIHSTLVGSGDGYGFISYTGYGEQGAYAPYAGMYICVTNNSGYHIFVPARTASELNNFKAYPPSGVSAW